MPPAPTASGAGRLPLIRFHIEGRDRHWWLTGGAMLALGIAVAMAVLGLPPVDLHGPLHKVGIMDPFCGGTRAARYTAQGDLAEAWRYNPLSILVVYGAGLAIGRAAVGVVTQRWLTVTIGWTSRRRHWVIAVLAVLMVMLEIRQQLRADLLMAGTNTWT
ncbi:DUF2752 domain-containing protein [Nocardioides speluncae]|uniref:DUF2752 domain-containing protein n=1 Tax=Nocardioides speluncae TaxID=2670337 RepID=UPI00137B5E79|nr:DUF2752 domain-containing protein [Nocardioides speluncae]